MPGPPPPPPGPPPPPSGLLNKGPGPPPPPSNIVSKAPASSGGRSALLSDIQKGARLKKVETNDRSAPVIGGKVGSATGSSSSSGSAIKPESNGKSSGPSVPGLGGLFANGVPKKPSEAKNLQAKSHVNSAPALVNSVPKASPPPKPFVSASNSGSTSSTPAPKPFASSNTSSSVPPPPLASTKPTPQKFTPKVPSTESSASAPLPPPKLKPTLPSQTYTLKKSASPPVESPQSPPYNTLRPTPNAIPKEAPHKFDNGERTLRPANRPSAAPPPVPPTVPSAQSKPNGLVNRQPISKPSPPRDPAPNTKTLPTRPAPPLPKQQVVSRSDMPPPPPTRVSSYIDSTDHRFHFLPVHELPLPENFVGFRKEYQNGGNRRIVMPH